MQAMRRTSRRSPGTAVLASVAASLHLATAIAAPLLHAQAEVMQSAAEVEASHSAQCPRLHAEGRCVVWPSFQLAAPAGASALPQLPANRSLVAPASALVLPKAQASRSHPVRGPPSR